METDNEAINPFADEVIKSRDEQLADLQAELDQLDDRRNYLLELLQDLERQDERLF